MAGLGFLGGWSAVARAPGGWGVRLAIWQCETVDMDGIVVEIASLAFPVVLGVVALAFAVFANALRQS